MKKKLLLISLMVALFICVFAISASAAIIPLDSDPGLDCDASLVSTLDIAAYGESNTATDRESRVVLTDGSKYYVFPAYYVVNKSIYYNPNGFNNTLKQAMANQGVTFSSIKECLVRIQIPTYVGIWILTRHSLMLLNVTPCSAIAAFNVLLNPFGL